MSRNASFLPWLSVNRPVTVVMILLALLVVGAIAYVRLPLALFPEGYEGLRLNVWISYRNSTPKDTEEKITKKVEDILGTVAHVDRITTESSSSGSQARLYFFNGTNMKKAYAEVTDRMDRVRVELPEEVDRIMVRRWDENDIPIIDGSISVADEVIDADFKVEQYIRPALQRIEGVGNVEINGIRGRELRIELDQEKLVAHRIDINELSRMLSSENFNVGGGDVRQGGKKTYVRSIGRIENVETIENLMVNRETGLKVRDVGKVSFAAREDWRVYRTEGRTAYGVEILKASQGNVSQISEEVRATMEQLESEPALAGFKFYISWDQGEHIRESINNLKNSGLWGGFFSVIVLLSFLRSPRMTFTVALAIPLSLLATMVGLYFLGWSLNLATMMGLLLCVGLVVDNSIVIAENIHVRRELGETPHQAAIDGASEVSLAVTMATLTTIVVFLPLMLMNSEGEMKFWFLRIGVPVIMGLAASLVVSLLMIPLATKRFPERMSEAHVVTEGTLRRGYGRVLGWSLRHRVDASLLVIVAFLSIFPVTGKLQKDQKGGGGGQGIWVSFRSSGAETLDEASVFYRQVESFVEGRREEYGYSTYNIFFSTSSGRLFISPKTENREWYEIAYRGILDKLGLLEKKDMTREEIVADIQEDLVVPPGYRMRLNWQNDENQSRSLSLTLYGDDTETLLVLSEEVERRLRTIDGLLAVETDVDPNAKEVNVALDREQAQRLGVSTPEVTSAIGYKMRGATIGRFYTDRGRELRVNVALEEADRDTLEQLRKLTFPADDGAEVPLESIARLTFSDSSGEIRREDRKTAMRIKAIIAKENSQQIFEDIDSAMQGFSMPVGYRWDKGGRTRDRENNVQSAIFAGGLAVVFVVLLMGILFESFVLPLAVFLSFPLASVGVIWTLHLTDTPLDMMALIGIVILVGVVVNNAIVLVDLANRLRSDGWERREALLEAGRRRFRPIWMTTLTTICGMLPMAVGGSRMIDMDYAPLGRAMIGGLLSSTLLTLVVVPVFYTFFDDLRIWVGSLFGSYLRNRGRRDAIPSQPSH